MSSKFIKPREKYFRYGIARLSNEDLVALILGFGTRVKDVFSLSKDVCKLIVNMKVVDSELLAEVLGKNKAARVVAAVELGKRLSEQDDDLLFNSRDVWHLMLRYAKAKKEYFVAFYLSVTGRLIAHEVISIGNVEMSFAHPREVFEPAIRMNAVKVIVAHNHPSGSLMPSKEDLSVTRRLIEAGKILGVELLDHVIVNAKGFVSMSGERIISF